MGQLGTAYEYNVIIADALSLEPLAYLPWTSINWQRSRNRITSADAFIAIEDLGVYQNGKPLVSSLRSWNQLLRIERNGAIVWDGPLVGWGFTSKRLRGQDKFGLSLKAMDRWIISQKLLIGGDMTFLGSGTGAYWPLPPAPLPIPWGPFGGGNVAYMLMYSAGLFDSPTQLPYPITLPALADFPSGLGRKPSGATGGNWPCMPMEREWRTSRLERLSTALDELSGFGYLSYAQVVDKLWVNDETIRNTLGPRGSRPVLSEQTALSTLGLNVDALEQINTAYTGRQGTGKSGFAAVTAADILPFTSVVGLLEDGIVLDNAFDRADNTDGAYYPTNADMQAQVHLYRRGVPAITIEQIPLAASFGSDTMKDDLSNLLPGVIVDLDFPEQAGLEIPFLDVILVDRLWCFDYSQSSNLIGSLLTPVYETTITKARMEQIDFSVTADNGGPVEEVRASLVPWADWDGHSPPVDWIEPTTYGYSRVRY